MKTKNRLLSFICIVALFMFSIGCVSAEKLDDVQVCVGSAREAEYYSRGSYIATAKSANPSIVKAQPVSTSMTISGYIYYGTTISFAGLAPGTTTVTMYSDGGAWMGSVTVKVTQHTWDKTFDLVFTASDNEQIPYVCAEATVIKTCKTCYTRETENLIESPAALPEIYRDLKQKSEGSDVANLQARLTELGYFDGTVSGTLDTKTWSAVNAFRKAAGQNTSASVSPDQQEILFSSAAPKKDQAVKTNVSKSYITLSTDMRGEAEEIRTLQNRLCELGYMSTQSGRYDSDTVRAILILKMKLGFRIVDSAAGIPLQALLERGRGEDLAIDGEAYGKYSALIEEATSQLQPTYKVQMTAGSNIRNKPSYDSNKLQWVNEGDFFDYLGEENGWYMIAMPDGTTGYVPADRSKVVEE
jgi:Putative peptidoglycan-binding domain-containing protein